MQTIDSAWTSEQAAQYLNCSIGRLVEKARLGQVPARKFCGKWLFEKEALADFVAGRYHAPRDGGLRIVKSKGAKQWQSTNEKTQATSGTSTTESQTAQEYDALVKQPTAKPHKNCTTRSKQKRGVSNS